MGYSTLSESFSMQFQVAARQLFLAIGALGWVAQAQAQESPAQPLWEIGAIGIAVTQQAYPGAAESVQQALAIPYGIYRGEFLRLDRGGAGIRAIHMDAFELDVGFSGSLGSRASDTVARQGMPDLGTLVEFGPRLRWNLSPPNAASQWRIDLPLRGVFDLSDGMAGRGAVIEPELKFSERAPNGWNYSAGLSAVWANEGMQSLFYTVKADQATSSRPVFAAQSGLMAVRLSASLSYPLATDTRLLVFGRIDSVQGAANQASPLVKQTTGTSIGVVLAYTWKKSEAMSTD